jgi:SAM-dependent methyltransferase
MLQRWCNGIMAMHFKEKLKRLVLRQCPRPFGLLGEYITFRMNRSHYQLTTWGLTHTTIERDHVLLDIGCGGGRTVQRLADLAPDGKVYGLDISEKSVAVTSRINRRAIREGRVVVKRGSVACLPFPDAAFDRVTAVETHYFWPDLAANLREVLRALRPGGQLVLIGEIYRCAKFEERNRKWVEMVGMPYHSVEELRAFFDGAGYDPVAIHENTDHGWICCVGTKPTPTWTATSN